MKLTNNIYVTTTLLAIMKYISKPKSVAVKDIDIKRPILWVRNIDIVSISPLVHTLLISVSRYITTHAVSIIHAQMVTV